MRLTLASRDFQTRSNRAGGGCETARHASSLHTVLSSADLFLLRAAGTLLVLVGGAKVFSALSALPALAQRDPVILFLSTRTVYLLTAMFEMLIAYLLFSRRPTFFAKYGLATLCATFVIYRVGVLALHIRPPCPCLGQLPAWLHLSREQADLVALCLLVILSTITIISLGLSLLQRALPRLSALSTGTSSELLLVSLFAIFHAPKCAAASVPQLRGSYAYAVYQGAEQPLFSSTCDFSIWLSRAGWAIEYTNAAKAALVKAGWNGNATYILENLRPQAGTSLDQGAATSSADPLPVATATILPWPYPTPTDTVLYHLWLAFASPSLLTNAVGKTKSPFLTDLAMFDNTLYDCTYHWDDSLRQSGLRSLVLMANGHVMTRDTSGRQVNAILAPPFAQGYTNAIARWLRTTNLSGVTFPLDFECTVLSPRFPVNDNQAQLVRAYSYRCTVIDCALSDMPSIPPVPPAGVTIVTDRRLARTGHARLTYAITNTWRSIDDEWILSLARRTPKLSLEDEVLLDLGLPPHSATRRYLIYLCLFAALFPFGVLAARRMLRQVTQSTQSRKGYMQTTRNLNLPAIAVVAGFAVAAVAGCLWDAATGTKCGTEMFNGWNAQPACVRVTCPSRTWCVPGFKYSHCWTEVYTNTCDKAVILAPRLCAFAHS